MNTLYRTTLIEAEEIVRRLDDAATRLCAAIAANTEAQARLRDAQRSYEGAKAAVIFDEGMNPEGKFKGIAATSKLYAAALDTLVYRAEQTGGQLSGITFALRAAIAKADSAASELAQAQALYGALKHIADLKGAIIIGENA